MSGSTQDRSECGRSALGQGRWCLALVLLALCLRAGLCWQREVELTQDRDAYLGLAESLSDGRGYSSPGGTQPTAYRPPLYPLVLSFAPTAQRGLWVAAVNVLAGAATVWLTILLAARLQLPASAALIAGLLVAVDPLLVRYASQPMTESLSTLLVTWCLLLCLSPARAVRAGLLTGVVFGLNVLCRPTLWVFGGLLAGWRIGCRLWNRILRRPGRSLAGVVGVVIGVGIVVGPWLVRNQIQLGRPILTTTHGGYTLLLANNRVFYDGVVRQPWGAVWDGSRGTSQAEWIASLQSEMQAEGVSGEVAEDRWMRDRAWREIHEDRAGFGLACLHRLRSFWNIAPQGEAAAEWPRWLLLAVSTWYAATLGLAAVGAMQVLIRRQSEWLPPLLLVASFTAVHGLYWSNVRMRAPLVPTLAVFTVVGGLSIVRAVRSVCGRSGAIGCDGSGNVSSTAR